MKGTAKFGWIKQRLVGKKYRFGCVCEGSSLNVAYQVSSIKYQLCDSHSNFQKAPISIPFVFHLS